MLGLKPETRKFIEKCATERSMTIEDVEKEIIEGYVNLHLATEHTKIGIPPNSAQDHINVHGDSRDYLDYGSGMGSGSGIVGNCLPHTDPIKGTIPEITRTLTDIFRKVNKATFEYDKEGIKINVSFNPIGDQEKKSENIGKSHSSSSV